MRLHDIPRRFQPPQKCLENDPFLFNMISFHGKNTDSSVVSGSSSNLQSLSLTPSQVGVSCKTSDVFSVHKLPNWTTPLWSKYGVNNWNKHGVLEVNDWKLRVFQGFSLAILSWYHERHIYIYTYISLSLCVRAEHHKNVSLNEISISHANKDKQETNGVCI